MIDCRQAQEAIFDRLDGRLDESVKIGLTAHLGSCAACRRLLAAQESLTGQLADLGRAADRIAAQPRPARTRSIWHRAPLRAAAAIAIVAGGIWFVAGLLNRDDPPRIAQRQDPAPFKIAEPVRSPVRITLTNDRTQWAVPLESKNPRIHIVWLYETVTPPDAGGPSKPTTGPAAAF